jgi:hypothetical protein
VPSCGGRHGGGLNEYGFQFQQNGQSFAAIEGLPSANINGGSTILDEINASAQPGWTTGANNNSYDFNNNLLASDASPPVGIAGDLDPTAPPVNEAPVANDDSATMLHDNATVTVTDAVGNGRTKFDFPEYTLDAAGEIVWTATIADGDADDDTATATTTLR